MEIGYQSPTEIQQKAIPQMLQHKEILGTAQTGTEKTAAFALPIIQKIDVLKAQNSRSRDIQALILSPTRELALQIDENIRQYSKYKNVRHNVIYGSRNQKSQKKNQKKKMEIYEASHGHMLDQ